MDALWGWAGADNICQQWRYARGVKTHSNRGISTRLIIGKSIGDEGMEKLLPNSQMLGINKEKVICYKRELGK